MPHYRSLKNEECFASVALEKGITLVKPKMSEASIEAMLPEASIHMDDARTYTCTWINSLDILIFYLNRSDEATWEPMIIYIQWIFLQDTGGDFLNVF
jgi:hypothetical protein